MDWNTYDYTRANKLVASLNVGVEIDPDSDIFEAFVLFLECKISNYIVNDKTLDLVIAYIWRDFNHCNNGLESFVKRRSNVVVVKGRC